MRSWRRRTCVDRDARDHAASIVSSLLDRSLEWSAVGSSLGAYSGTDQGVSAIHAELRSVAAAGYEFEASGDDPELRAVLRRTERFLRSDCGYRWHHRGPVEIMGTYLGVAALAWICVGFAGFVLGYGHEAVIAGALFAFLLMYVMAGAMAVALLRRLWWRIAARREGADRNVWPFFTPAEYRAARLGRTDAGEC